MEGRAEECAKLANCRIDGLAVYRFQFSRSHVSKLDYFHPKPRRAGGAGQRDLGKLAVVHRLTRLAVPAAAVGASRG